MKDLNFNELIELLKSLTTLYSLSGGNCQLKGQTSELILEILEILRQ